MGWFIIEDFKWNEVGKLISENMVIYKILVIGDMLKEFNVKLFGRKNVEDSIYYLKVVGELLFMLVILVWCVFKDVIFSLFGYIVDL